MRVAELRNRVYDVILDNMRKKKAVHTRNKHGMSLSNVPKYSAYDYRGLTQVCQKIRDEFRPLYISAKTFRVGIKSALRFLRAYYPEKNVDQAPPRVAGGQLIIVLEDTWDASSFLHGQRWKRSDTPERLFDLMPILKICLLNNNIDIAFTTDPFDLGSLQCPRSLYAREFNRWFRGHRDAWKDAIRKDLCHILFTHNFKGDMELVFKQLSDQSWVREVCAKWGLESEEQEAYLSTLGLCDPGYEGDPLISRRK
tara:strand:+ start:1699 stop:2460 length:762 start_codon:yes stop_codon:yes gene_type:complete